MDQIAEDVGQTFAKTLSALDHIRANLAYESQDTIEAQLRELQSGVKSQAQGVIDTINAELKNTARPSIKYRQRPTLKTSEDPLAQKFMNNPSSELARDYLEKRYGIPKCLSQPQPRRARDDLEMGNMYKGLNAQSGLILPQAYRHDPHQEMPPYYIDFELQKGILHLVQKRLLHLDVDLGVVLHGSSPIIRAMNSKLHPMPKRSNRPIPSTILEDVILSKQRYKMDILTSPGKLKQAKLKGQNKTLPVEPSLPPVTNIGEWSHHNSDSSSMDSIHDIRAQRNYNQMMDAHSLHEIYIRKGVTLDKLPEFVSFYRAHINMWQPIVQALMQLEALCKQYDIPLVIVDGKALAKAVNIAFLHGKTMTLKDIIGTAKNVQELVLLLQQPGRRYLGPEGQNHAAVQIQSQTRAFLARKKYKVILGQQQAARSIQYAWKTLKLRREVVSRMNKARDLRESKFLQLQDELQRTWDDVRAQTHVIIHLANQPVHPLQATQTESQAIPILQLPRLLDLADPLVEVAFVSPQPVHADVQVYWQKLLEVGGVQDSPSRYKILYPENGPRLPADLPLTAQLLCSPRALKRLQMFIGNRPAYIIPSDVTQAELDLAVHLQAPLLGGHPTAVAALSYRSSHRHLFNMSQINVLPGTTVLPHHQKPDRRDSSTPSAGLRGLRFDLNLPGRLLVKQESDTSGREEGEEVPGLEFGGEEGGAGGEDLEVLKTSKALGKKPRLDDEVIMQLADVMVGHSEFSKWLIKVEGCRRGCGVAYVEAGWIRGVSSVISRYKEVLEESKSNKYNTMLHEQLEQEAKQVACHRIALQLHKYLPKKLRIIDTTTFPSYSLFLKHLIEQGGVIEACPTTIIGHPHVNMLIEPAGAVRIISTHDSIQSPQFSPVGSLFPQATVPPGSLYNAAIAVGHSCFETGIIGHVSVSFVAGTHRAMARMWATSLHTQYSTSLVSFQLFDYMVAGSFDAMAGHYVINDDSDSGSVKEGSAHSGGTRSRGGGGVWSGTGSVSGRVTSTTRSSVTRQSLEGLENESRFRYYATLDVCQHDALRMVAYQEFFAQARLHWFSFDIGERMGTIFNITHKVSVGWLGVQCIEEKRDDAVATLLDVLQFVDERIPKCINATKIPTASLKFRGILNTLKQLGDQFTKQTRNGEQSES